MGTRVGFPRVGLLIANLSTPTGTVETEKRAGDGVQETRVELGYARENVRQEVKDRLG